MTKLNSSKNALLGMALALLVPAGSAMGYSFIDLGLGLNSYTNFGANVNTGVSLDTATRSVKTNIETSSGVQSGTSTQSQSSSVIEAGPRIDGSSSLDLGEGEVIRVDRKQSGSVSANGSGTAYISLEPSSVSTRTDLEAYASSTIQADQNIGEMTFARDYVEMVYKQPGRLLSVFPVTFDAKAVIYADGRIEVEYPWYTFMVSDNRAQIKAQIEEAVAPVILSGASATSASSANISPEGASFSARSSAEVALRVREVLKRNLSKDLEATITQEVEMQRQR